MANDFDMNIPVPNSHLEPLYRQTYNSYGMVDAASLDLTQANTTLSNQAKNNTRLNSKTNKGLLAGSVAAVAGDGTIGPCLGDSTSAFDMAVGIVVNDAVGNPYESSSAVGSNRIVYAHGSGTVLKTDIYETATDATSGNTPITYTAGDRLYASQNGLLTNASGLSGTIVTAIGNNTYQGTVIGVVLHPGSQADPWMVFQMKI